MNLLVRKLLTFILSSLIFLSCSGKQELRKDRVMLSIQPSQAKLQTPQAKGPPPNPLAYYHFLLSQAKLKEGKLDEAIEDLKLAITYDEKEPSLHVELATLYIHKGLLSEAIEECNNALSHDPDHLLAHLLLGGIYSTLKKNHLAIESYKKVLEIDPRHLESYLFLSSLYSDLKEYNKAIFAKLDVKASEENLHIAIHHGVMSTPTLKVFC